MAHATLSRPLHVGSPGRDPETASSSCLGIAGLSYFEEVLRSEEQQRILDEIDARPWLHALRRRVQQYGYQYDYKARAIDHTMYLGPLPEFALRIAEQLLDRGLIVELPDQLIVNEYLPGQGIAPHIDCVACFKNTIVTVSLGSPVVMDFTSVATGERRSLRLAPGSVLILRDEARYHWKHAIAPRKFDQGVRRERRVSLTFRNVLV